MKAQKLTARSEDALIAVSYYKMEGRGRTKATGYLPDLLAVGCATFQALTGLTSSYATMDLRGLGKSVIHNVEKAHYGLPEYMSDFDAVLAAMQADTAVLLGYSHAAYFATSYALARPERVRALVLVEPALFTDSAELERRATLADNRNGAAAIASMLRHADCLVGFNLTLSSKTVRSIMGHVQDDRVLATEFRLRAHNPITERDLASIKVPVLVIGGTDSRVRHSASRVFSLIDAASCWWIRGATHLDIMDAKYADEMSSLVRVFLGCLATAPAARE